MGHSELINQLTENIIHTSSHHAIFGFLFLFVTILALYRVYLYRDFSGRGKVVTIFYSLISFTSFVRSIWFFSFSYTDSYYLPIHPLLFTEPGAGWCLLSEALNSLGSSGLYLIFILIACYWSQLLTDTSNASYNARLTESESDSFLSPFIAFIRQRELSMMQLFGFNIAVLLICSCINVLLFTSKVFDSEDMILYDSVELTVVSLATMFALTLLSRRIQTLLLMIGAINNSSTQAQIRRIVAITYAANIFFVARVSIEVSFLIAILVLYIQGLSLSTLLLDQYWDVYVVLKHSTELAILVLELFISTAIKIYSTDSGQGTGGRIAGRNGVASSSESTPLLDSNRNSTQQPFNQQQRSALKYVQTTVPSSYASTSSNQYPVSNRLQTNASSTHTINI